MQRTSRKKVLPVILAAVLLTEAASYAVTSQIVRHSTAAEFLKGKTDKTVIDSTGALKLAPLTEEIDCTGLLEDVWTINTIVSDNAGNVYLGTSPGGDIIMIKDGKASKIYPLPAQQSGQSGEQAQPPQMSRSDSDAPPPQFANRHVFALALDNAGRLLAGISGKNCCLVRFDDEPVTLFEPEETDYILAILLDRLGNIYVGTGPKGRLYRLDSSGQNPELIYQCRDNNILSLAAGADGCIYAGCDQRGIVYRIDPARRNATILFDAEQPEITALVFDAQGNLYAAATGAQTGGPKTQLSSIAAEPSSGKPDAKTKDDLEKNASLNLNTANTAAKTQPAPPSGQQAPARGVMPKTAGRIYRITPEGFATEIFSEMTVFFAMTKHNDRLLLGTGNSGMLFDINPETEEKFVAYEDTQSSQISAAAVVGQLVYLGTSNPPRLKTLAQEYNSSGLYTSELIDAGQPALWGRLQIDADIPAGCGVMLSARSGNVNDPNDPTFSDWSRAIQITQAVPLDCPVGRFCQYRLSLTGSAPAYTPVIREVAVAHVVPNLAPKVLSIEVARTPDKKRTNIFQINFKAEDDNKDELVYKIEFRKPEWNRWIKLKDEVPAPKFEWDTLAVEDGRYEIRVTADDRRSNSPPDALTDSRISDSFVVDNTGPIIKEHSIQAQDGTVTLKLAVQDKYTVIGKVSYTIDGGEDFRVIVPDDMVSDTVDEDYTIVIKDLEKGQHIITVQLGDDIGNTTYRTFDVTID